MTPDCPHEFKETTNDFLIFSFVVSLSSWESFGFQFTPYGFSESQFMPHALATGKS